MAASCCERKGLSKAEKETLLERKARVLFWNTVGMHPAWRITADTYLQEKTCDRHYTLQGVHRVGTEGEYTLGTRSFMIPVYRRHHVWHGAHIRQAVSLAGIVYTWLCSNCLQWTLCPEDKALSPESLQQSLSQ